MSGSVPALPWLESFGAGISQVCCLVDDLDAALANHIAFSSATFDVYVPTPETHPVLRRGGERTTLSIRYALSRTSPQIELIQPLGGESIYTEHMARFPHGFHHVAYLVSNMTEARRRMGRAGYDSIFEGEGLGIDGDGAFAYYDTRAILGFYIELIQPPARRHPPAETVGPPERRGATV